MPSPSPSPTCSAPGRGAGPGGRGRGGRGAGGAARLAFVGDALTHTVFPGVVIAHLLGRSILLGALAFRVLTAILLTGLGLHRRVGDDAALAILLTSFFSSGWCSSPRTEASPPT